MIKGALIQDKTKQTNNNKLINIRKLNQKIEQYQLPEVRTGVSKATSASCMVSVISSTLVLLMYTYNSGDIKLMM